MVNNNVKKCYDKMLYVCVTLYYMLC